MSFSYTVDVMCDGLYCHNVISTPAQKTPSHYSARSFASKHGWVLRRINRTQMDLCPDCKDKYPSSTGT